MSENFLVDNLSPEELEVSLFTLPKHPSCPESNSQQHVNAISDFREPLSTVPEVTPQRRAKMRIKRMKRGDSLEREIAKLILSEAHSNLEVYPGGTLSPREILSDLISSHNDVSHSSDEIEAEKSNEIIESKNSQATYIDDSTTAGQFVEDNFSVVRPRELYPKASCDSDAFDFDANNNEWAEFDGRSIFGIERKSSRELDGDGFPVPHEESHEETSSSKMFDIQFDEDSSSAKASVEADKEKDSSTKAEEVFGKTQSASVVSCDEKSLQVESKAELSSLSGDFEVNFRKFESELREKGHRTGQPYAFKRQASTVSKAPWSPKPPEHYKNSNIVLYQPEDSLF